MESGGDTPMTTLSPTAAGQGQGHPIPFSESAQKNCHMKLQRNSIGQVIEQPAFLKHKGQPFPKEEINSQERFLESS